MPSRKKNGDMASEAAIGSTPRRSFTIQAMYEPRMTNPGWAMLTTSSMPNEIDTPTLSAA